DVLRETPRRCVHRRQRGSVRELAVDRPRRLVASRERGGARGQRRSGTLRGSSPVNIVVPMAGRGQRFVDAAYDVPKPLIDVLGRPMYSWAVDCLPLALSTRLVFVCLDEHLEGQGLGRDIRERYAEYSPVVFGL